MYHSKPMFYGTRSKLKFSFQETYLKYMKPVGFMMYPSNLEIFSSGMSDDLLVTIMSQVYILEGGACTDETECCSLVFSFLELLNVTLVFIDFSEVIQGRKTFNSVSLKSFQTQEAIPFTQYHKTRKEIFMYSNRRDV